MGNVIHDNTLQVELMKLKDEIERTDTNNESMAKHVAEKAVQMFYKIKKTHSCLLFNEFNRSKAFFISRNESILPRSQKQSRRYQNLPEFHDP